jgi:uncharacterized protein (DUF58 family)
MAMNHRDAREARGGNMNKEILKGFTIFTLMVALAILTSVVSANAQSRVTVSASIPFEFVVGDRTLPAGEYNLRPATSGDEALMVQNAENGNAIVRLTEPALESKKKQARLVFHRYGQSYFLAEVWKAEGLGRRLAKSKQERGVERELASIPSKSDLAQSLCETVEVVAVLR